MAELREISDLLPLLSQGYEGADPIRGLAARGHTVSEALSRAMDEATVGMRLSASARQRSRAMIPAGTTLRASIGEIAYQKVERSAVAVYDLLLAMRLSFANAAIAAMQAEGLIPDAIDAEQAAQLFPAETLAHLQQAPVSTPHAPASPSHPRSPFPLPPAGPAIEGTASELSFSAPPSLHPASEPGHINLAWPFVLAVTLSDRSRTSFIATLHLDIEVQLAFDTDKTIVHPTIDAGRTRSVRLIHAQNSPLVPRSVVDTTALAGELHSRLSLLLAILPPLVLPPIRLPTGGEGLVPKRADASTSGEGDLAALIIGVQTEGSTGNPSAPPSPFSTAQHDAYVRLHEDFLSRVFRATAFEPDFLAAVTADTGIEGLQLDDASVIAKPGRLLLRVDGRIVNLCAFGKDLRFSNTTALTFSVTDGALTVTRDSDLTLSELDVVLCVLLSGIEALLFSLPFALLAQLTRARPLLRGIFEGDGDGGEEGPAADVFSASFSTEAAVAGLEQKLSATLREVKTDETALHAMGGLQLIDDETSTFVYARILQDGEPLAGVIIDLMDQDKPPPPGDDAHVLGTPVTSETPLFSAGNDQVLATALADGQGLVRFVLPESKRASIAGRIQLGLLQRPVREAAPDLYLRVHLPSGRTLDTRGMKDGFALNQGAGHLGTRSSPLVFDFKRLEVP